MPACTPARLPSRTAVLTLLPALFAASVAAAPPRAAETSEREAERAPVQREAIAQQREAMAALARLDGEWRGTATATLPSGEQHTMVQTERVGPLLGGTLRLIEGRGYAADGTPVFHAVAVLSYDVARQAYSMRSYAAGQAGDFPFRATADGFEWEIPSPAGTTRYRARVTDGHWEQSGERLVEGQPPQRMFEMQLTRIGDTAWPDGGAVPPTP